MAIASGIRAAAEDPPVTLAPLLAMLALIPADQGAPEIPVGTMVVMKSKDGVRVGDLAPGGERAFRAYTVRQIDGARLRLASEGGEGWVDAAEVIPRDRAAEHFTQILRDDPRAAWAYARRGAILLVDPDRRAEAVADLTRAIDLDPVYAPAFGYRGSAYLLDGDHDRAIADLNRAVRLDPRYAIAYSNRGEARGIREEYLFAITDFTEAIRLDPKIRAAFAGRGAARNAKGDHRGAIADYTEALKLDPADVTSLAFRGDIYCFDTHEPDRAIADYDEALRIAPGLIGVHLARGWAYFNKEDYPRAITDFTEVIRLDPNDPRGPSDRSLAWDALKEPQKALADLDAAIRLDPDNPLTRERRGRLRAQARDYAGAVDDLRAAIRLDPDDPMPKNLLARIRSCCPVSKFRGGEEAVALALKACEIDGGKEGFFLRTLAASYAEAGDFARAVETETKALDRFDNEVLKDSCRDRIELYKQKTPYRDPD